MNLGANKLFFYSGGVLREVFLGSDGASSTTQAATINTDELEETESNGDSSSTT